MRRVKFVFSLCADIRSLGGEVMQLGRSAHSSSSSSSSWAEALQRTSSRAVIRPTDIKPQNALETEPDGYE